MTEPEMIILRGCQDPEVDGQRLSHTGGLDTIVAVVKVYEPHKFIRTDTIEDGHVVYQHAGRWKNDS